jgi:hypothetical protein
MLSSKAIHQPSKHNSRKMISQYYAQRILAERWEAMESCVGFTFRPGGFKDSFAESAYRHAAGHFHPSLGAEW